MQCIPLTYLSLRHIWHAELSRKELLLVSQQMRGSHSPRKSVALLSFINFKLQSDYLHFISQVRFITPVLLSAVLWIDYLEHSIMIRHPRKLSIRINTSGKHIIPNLLNQSLNNMHNIFAPCKCHFQIQLSSLSCLTKDIPV